MPPPPLLLLIFMVWAQAPVHDATAGNSKSARTPPGDLVTRGVDPAPATPDNLGRMDANSLDMVVFGGSGTRRNIPLMPATKRARCS